VRTFDTDEQLGQALLEFRRTYNSTWRIERHDFRPSMLSARISFQPRPRHIDCSTMSR
jgi:hypothetical protein